MSNYSDKSFTRRKSPRDSSSRHRKHSRSRSAHYSPPPRRELRSRSRSDRSRSPLPAHYHHSHRPVYVNSRSIREDHEKVRYNPPENKVLAIFGLSKRVIEQDLFDLYKNFGGKECKVIIDKTNGCPKGYGFVYFSRTKDAIIAREKTDGITMFGKPIRVDFSIGERDYTTTATAPSYSSSSRHPRDYSRDTRPSPRYIEHSQTRDHHHHRMPRESTIMYNMDRDRDRYASPYRESVRRNHHHRQESESYSDNHGREIERRRIVATPPLPDRKHAHSNRRSRSRSPDRSRKHHDSEYQRSSHDHHRH